MSLVGHQVMSYTEPPIYWSPVKCNPASKLWLGLLIICLLHTDWSAFQALFLMWVSGVWHNWGLSPLGSLI